MKTYKMIIAACLLSAGMSAGAAKYEAKAEEAAAIGETQNIAGWEITAEEVMRSKELNNVAVELGYTGAATSTFELKAEDGKEYCLIKLKISKDGSKESIEWEQMTVEDENGNSYARCEDEFIKELGMKRMAGTKLNFGENEGWVAYEVEENAEELTLLYDFAEATYSCKLTQ